MEEAIENSTSENAVTYQKYLERCVDRRPAWRARCKQRRLKSRLTTLTHEGPGAFVPQCEMINICPMVSSVVGKIQKNLPKGSANAFVLFGDIGRYRDLHSCPTRPPSHR